MNAWLSSTQSSDDRENRARRAGGHPESHSHRNIALGSLLLLLLFSGSAGSQQPPVISVEVKAVTVYATVRDKHGTIVPELAKDDFALKEDGRPQTIEYFARESDLPLTLGLMVDTSLSQQRVLGQERTASYSFLDRLLREDKDHAFLIHFDFDVELLQGLTSSRQQLQSGLALLHIGLQPRFSRSRRRGGGRYPPPQQTGGGTLLYDAVYLASNEMMREQSGRKALIVLSDGVDIGSQEDLDQAVEAAQRADTIVYSILFADDGFYAGYPGFGSGWPFSVLFPSRQLNGKKVLERISSETGGRLFQVSKKLTIDAIYAQISEELRNQYSLAYTPNPANPGAGYHKIALSTKQKGLVVQARKGYYSTH